MASSTKSQPKTSPEMAVKKAVQMRPGATIEGIAKDAGVARSTAGKALSRLADSGVITRHEGGRDGRKRLPDRFTLAGVNIPAAYAKHIASAVAPKRAAASKRGSGNANASDVKGARSSDSKSVGKVSEPVRGEQRLKAGGLEPLVLEYLKENADTAPHGPSTIARALDRSSGAVSNCLVRLTEAKKVKRDSEKPRRYSIAA